MALFGTFKTVSFLPMFLFFGVSHGFLCCGTCIHGIWVPQGKLGLWWTHIPPFGVIVVVVATPEELPMWIVVCLVCLWLSWLGGTSFLLSPKPPFLDPILLLLLHHYCPLFEVGWFFKVYTCFCKRNWETKLEHVEGCQIINIDLGSCAEKLEVRNVLINIPSLHFQFLQIIMSLFMGCIVDEGFPKYGFHDLPNIHPMW